MKKESRMLNIDITFIVDIPEMMSMSLMLMLLLKRENNKYKTS